MKNGKALGINTITVELIKSTVKKWSKKYIT